MYEMQFDYRGDIKLNKRNFMIDYIKCVATVCVLTLHVGIISGGAFEFYFSDRTWIFQTPAWSAVWIFFALSGSLNGTSFFSKKFDFNKQGILNFYLVRITKVLIPTWAFIFIVLCLIDLRAIIDNPIVIVKVLTLRYYNNPAITSIGATWYVFVLMQLYFITPLLAYLIEKIMNGKSILFHTTVIALIAAIGLCVRIITFKAGIAWNAIYVPWYMNLDLYLSGMISAHACCYQTEYVKTSCIIIVIGLGSLIVLVVTNTRLFYLANTNSIATFVCQYVFPTVWLLYVCAYFYIFSKSDFEPKLFGRIVKKFAAISFYIYLVHSMVANQIAPFVVIESINKRYMCLLILTLFISMCLGTIMNRASINYSGGKKMNTGNG